jgi:alpha-1,6-mannosyltransferase
MVVALSSPRLRPSLRSTFQSAWARMGEPHPPAGDVAGRIPLRSYAVAGFLAAAAVVVGAVVGGQTFISHVPWAWFFGTPGGPLGSVASSSSHAPAVAVLGVYGGLAALAVVWWRLMAALGRHPGTSVRSVVKVVAAWAVPFLAAPPLFSKDVYSYAGQGQMVAYHINPYHYGPGVLGSTPWNLLAGPLWANTPSPYGPGWLSLDGLAASLSHHEVLADLVFLRILALIGVALLVVGLPTLARHLRRDPALVVALGAGSPLVLGTLLGGDHNDALMVGLMVAGLALWVRVGAVPGIVVCALAAAVKAPALVAVLFIGWNWAPLSASIRTRVVRTLGASALACAVLAAVAGASGLGWGWVKTLDAPGKVSTGVTPVDTLARVVADSLAIVGMHPSLSTARSAAAVVGVLAAVVIGAVLLWRSPQTGPLRALGLALLFAALLGPVLWAWYVTWGLVVLAPVARGRLWTVVVSLTVLEALVGAASVISVVRSLGSAGVLSDLLVGVGGIAACVLAARIPYEVPERSPWVRQRALQPAGVTVTAIQVPQSGQ